MLHFFLGAELTTIFLQDKGRPPSSISQEPLFLWGYYNKCYKLGSLRAVGTYCSQLQGVGTQDQDTEQI